MLFEDRLTNELLAHLRAAGDTGLTRQEISDLFNRQRTSAQLGRSLAELAEAGLARKTETKTKGRPVTRWHLTAPADSHRKRCPAMQASFTFENGKFIPEDRLSLSVEGMDPSDILRSKGFLPAQEFGDSNGFSFEVHEKAVDDGCGWVVFVNTPRTYATIFVADWPSLIGLLAMLSPIALAGMTVQQEGRILPHFRVQPAEARK